MFATETSVSKIVNNKMDRIGIVFEIDKTDLKKDLIKNIFDEIEEEIDQLLEKRIENNN